VYADARAAASGLGAPRAPELGSDLRHGLCAMDPPVTQFGDYVLFERLGRGGSGIVFRAQRVGSGEMVALKQMRGGAHATPDERQAFLFGAETAAGLHHPGIVRVRDVGESDNCPFFTMDLLAGDLAAALDLGQPPPPHAARWMLQIALAVQHAHSCNVLHRDLKPANILLDETGNPFVSDFGSAKRLSEQGRCLESGEGLIGFYVAPEQATGDARALTHRADIYSLGVIFYELLTGQVPYEQLAFADWVSELVGPDPVRSPHELEANVNRHLERICLKCLEKEPSRRYESAAHLADELARVLSDWNGPPPPSESALSRALHWVRRHPLRAAWLRRYSDWCSRSPCSRCCRRRGSKNGARSKRTGSSPTAKPGPYSFSCVSLRIARSDAEKNRAFESCFWRVW